MMKRKCHSFFVLFLLYFNILFLFPDSLASVTLEYCPSWNYIARRGDFTLSRYAPFMGEMKNNEVYGLSVAIDGENFVYVCGNYRGGGSVNLNHQQTLPSSISLSSFVAKFTNDSSIIWSKQINSYGLSAASSFMCFDVTACHSENTVVVAGLFSGDAQFGNKRITGDSDLFIVKYTALEGEVVWVKKVKTATSSNIRVSIDSQQSVILSGICTGEIAFEDDAGQLQYYNCNNKQSDKYMLEGGFIGKFSKSGSFVAAKTFPAVSLQAFSVDLHGNMLLVLQNARLNNSISQYDFPSQYYVTVLKNLSSTFVEQHSIEISKYFYSRSPISINSIVVPYNDNSVYVSGSVGADQTKMIALKASLTENKIYWTFTSQDDYYRVLPSAVYKNGNFLLAGEIEMGRSELVVLRNEDGAIAFRKELEVCMEDIAVDPMFGKIFVVGTYIKPNSLLDEDVPLRLTGHQDGFLATFKHDCSCDNFDCQIPLCAGNPPFKHGVCSGRGWCMGPNKCKCFPGFAGNDCQFPICGNKLSIDPDVCSGRGKCIYPERCDCEPNYSGYLCNVTSCFDIIATNPSVCSGSGVCIAKDICQCIPSRTGQECTVEVKYSETYPLCPERNSPDRSSILVPVALTTPKLERTPLSGSIMQDKSIFHYNENRMIITKDKRTVITGTNLSWLSQDSSKYTIMAKVQPTLWEEAPEVLWTLKTDLMTSLYGIREDSEGAILYVGVYIDPQSSLKYSIVGKVGKEGEKLWERKLKASVTRLRSVEVDSANDVYVSGGFLGIIDLDNCKVMSSPETLFMKLDGKRGTCLFVERGAGAGNIGEAIVATQNSILQVGSFSQSVVFQNYALYSDESLGYLVKYNIKKEKPEVAWARTTSNPLSGERAGIVRNIFVKADLYGNIVVAGVYRGSMNVDLPRRPWIHSRGMDDVFIQKFDSNGNLRYMRTIGGVGKDFIGAIQIDSNGSVYALMTLRNPAFYVDDEYFEMTNESLENSKLVLVRLCPYGNLLYWTYFAQNQFNMSGSDLAIHIRDDTTMNNKGELHSQIAKTYVTVYLTKESTADNKTQMYMRLVELTDSWCEEKMVSPAGWNPYIWVASGAGAGGFIFALSCVAAICVIKRHTVKQQKKKAQADEEASYLLNSDEGSGKGKKQPNFRIDTNMFIVQYGDLTEFREIGVGASGAIVYRAKLKGEIVAVKVFRTSYILSSHENYEEFEHEVKLLASIRHNNIVNFYGAFLESRIGFVTEHCGRGSLMNVVTKETGKLALERKLRMLLDIATGMNYLHSKNVVHRDLKSANVLVDMNYVCKVADFGLSKMVDMYNRSHQLTKRVGTSMYMAPEVTLGGHYNLKCDVFSFAIIMFEVYFEQSNVYQHNVDVASTFNIEVRVAHDPTFRPKIPEDAFAKINPAMEWYFELMNRCWDHDYEKRPSFETIVSEFESFLCTQCKLLSH